MLYAYRICNVPNANRRTSIASQTANYWIIRQLPCRTWIHFYCGLVKITKGNHYIQKSLRMTVVRHAVLIEIELQTLRICIRGSLCILYKFDSWPQYYTGRFVCARIGGPGFAYLVYVIAGYYNLSKRRRCEKMEEVSTELHGIQLLATSLLLWYSPQSYALYMWPIFSKSRLEKRKGYAAYISWSQWVPHPKWH